jgi:glycosyltransferase involved in cell wall biosynthesis
VKTDPGRLSVVQVNYAYDKGLTDPDALLDRYFTLTGWSEALVRAGAGPVAVVQQFHRDLAIARNGVEYRFRRSGIAAAVAARRPDIAHVNGLIFPARTWLLRRALDRPSAIVVQNHSDAGAVGRAPALRIAGRAARSAVDAFLFAAVEHAAAWRRAGIVAAQQRVYQVMEASTRLRALPRAAARAASGLRGSPAILWVGRLNMNKDPLTVLDAFERCAADLPAATLTMIYGTDELLEEVRARIARSPALRERVHLAGAIPHERMAAYYSAADMFIAGSRHEGSGYALMEACACGAIPVVTEIPTFHLMTAAGTAGALWTAGYAASCARAIADVAARDWSAQRATLAAHFDRELSWEAVGRRALAIYQEVTATRTAAD